MGAKPTFALAVPGEALRSRLPARAKHLANDRQFAGTTLDAVIFTYSAGAVVTRRALEKALAKVKGRSHALVIVGWDFTVEARALLDMTKAIVLFDREFGWTEAMWAEIQQSDRSPTAEVHPEAVLDAESLVVVRDFLLKGMAWDLSRPHFMENQRQYIAKKAQSDPMFATKLRVAALQALESQDPSVIRRGLTALAFVGTGADAPVVERLKTHFDLGVSKDAGTCLYELKR